jgi:hypothetical protein
VEEATTDLAQVVTASVEKAVRTLEKAVAEMEEGGRPGSGAVEMPAGGHSDVVENNAEAA